METENITVEYKHKVSSTLLSLQISAYHSDFGYVKYKITFCSASEMLRIDQYVKLGHEFYNQVPIYSLPIKVIQFILKELNINV